MINFVIRCICKHIDQSSLVSYEWFKLEIEAMWLDPYLYTNSELVVVKYSNFVEHNAIMMEFSINNDMKNYFSNAKASLFDSPATDIPDEVIDQYFHKISDENINQESTWNISTSILDSSINSLSESLEMNPNDDSHSFSTMHALLQNQPLLKFRIIQFLPDYFMLTLASHDKDIAFYQFYSSHFSEFTSGKPSVQAKLCDVHFNLDEIERDAKYSQKLWLRDIFGLQYYSIWESTFKQLVKNELLNAQLLKSMKKLAHSNIGIILCHGGYFAGGVWKNNVCVIHKAFHKYVVRKKQGKRQVTRDKTKKASSVGAEMRRQNEMHFKKKLIELLFNWKSHLDSCNIILISAPGSINRSYIFGESFLQENDARLSSIPIHLEGNPNFEKVKEVYETFTSVNAVFVSTPPKTVLLNSSEKRKLFTSSVDTFQEWMNEENS